MLQQFALLRGDLAVASAQVSVMASVFGSPPVVIEAFGALQGLQRSLQVVLGNFGAPR